MKEDTLYSDSAAHSYLDRQIEDRHHRSLLDSVLSWFGACRGDTVVELGAGSGRYTEMLLAVGYRVIAYEPDPHLSAKLRERLGERDGLEIRNRGIRDLSGTDVRAEIVCGFHVLHHLNKEHLQMLAGAISSIRKKTPRFKGWFFLEPNPLNVLYPLSILLTPGMKFREERGLWRLGYQILKTGGDGKSEVLGTVGMFPPRRIVSMLPAGIAKLGTSIREGRSLLRLYAVIGEVG
ncbi:MAG: methyltransferase domain-containing protein [Smithella sp.]|jgi:SAM-dependent methyltransferase